MEKIWREIPGFSKYKVSRYGRIKSMSYRRTGHQQLRKASVNSSGYEFMILKGDNGKLKSWSIHKWVTFTFYGEVPEGMEVNHINGNKLNNYLSNLEYCTRSQNVKHSFDTGLQTPLKGEYHPSFKLSDKDVLDIRQYAKANGKYYGRKELAKRYNVCMGTISLIVSLRRR